MFPLRLLAQFFPQTSRPARRLPSRQSYSGLLRVRPIYRRRSDQSDGLPGWVVDEELIKVRSSKSYTFGDDATRKAHDALEAQLYDAQAPGRQLQRQRADGGSSATRR